MTWPALIKNINAATQALAEQQALAAASGSAAAAPSTDEATARAELRIIELDESEARLKDDLERHQAIVTREEAAATAIGNHITDLQNALADSNDQLRKMREVAGLDDASGVGAEKKKLAADLAEANIRLRYLEDTSKGTADDLRAMEAQKKAVEDLTAQLNDAEKRFRVADYELTHSDAWQAQLKAIADQQAVIAKAQQQQAAEQKRIDVMKADLAVREAAIQKLEAERAQQQAILDKQQKEAAAQAAADRKAQLQQELGMLSTAAQQHVAVLKATGAAVEQQVQNAGVTIQAAAVTASTSIATNATAVVQAAGTAIAQRMSESLANLLSILTGGAGGPTGAGGGNYGGQGFEDRSKDPFAQEMAKRMPNSPDPRGEMTGGYIGDDTYAEWVKDYAYTQTPTAPADWRLQFQKAQDAANLNLLWQALGGLARFHKTLDQMVALMKQQGTAIAGLSPQGSRATPSSSTPHVTVDPARARLYLPLPGASSSKPQPKPWFVLQALIRTGQL